MFNFHVIPYKRSGRAGGLSVFAAGVSAFFLVAALFLSSCTDEETVEVPGPTVTTTVPGPTVTVPADINGTAGNDELSGSHIDDTIDGMAGDDMIEGDNGNDTLMGGAGDDEISGGTITAKKEVDATDSDNNAIKKSVVVTGCARGANPTGSDGDDTIHGGDDDDKLYGGSDNDTIYGEGGDDLLCGNSGNDTLMGGADDDHLDGGRGDDTIDGGDGDDMVDYSSSPMAITVDLAKSDIIQDGFFGRDTLSGIETIKGSSQADTLTGDDGDNTFMPGAGADVLDGGAGTDTLDYSDAMTLADTPAATGVTINLGAHTCTTGTSDNPATETIITVASSNTTANGDTIRAPHGKDKDGATICLSSIENVTGGAAAAANNTLDGDSQANVLKGGAGVDDLDGAGGNDMIYGMGGNDSPLDGGAGDDTIYGGAGDDTINGEAGNDMLHGGAGQNTYNGGAGDDTYYITDTADVDGNFGITEGSDTGDGTDTVSLAMYESDATTPTGFTATLDENVENVIGSKYADTLTGNAGDNEIDGGSGNDTLSGGAGDDTFVVRSGEGNDNISDATADDEIVFMGFADGTTASYRAVTGGFVITVGSQSIQVTTALTEENLKKIVEIK